MSLIIFENEPFCISKRLMPNFFIRSNDLIMIDRLYYPAFLFLVQYFNDNIQWNDWK